MRSGDRTVMQQFTGKERDLETGLDYFLALHYSGAPGRYYSPDEPLLDQYVGDPQRWNLVFGDGFNYAQVTSFMPGREPSGLSSASGICGRRRIICWRRRQFLTGLGGRHGIRSRTVPDGFTRTVSTTPRTGCGSRRIRHRSRFATRPRLAVSRRPFTMGRGGRCW